MQVPWTQTIRTSWEEGLRALLLPAPDGSQAELQWVQVYSVQVGLRLLCKHPHPYLLRHRGTSWSRATWVWYRRIGSSRRNQCR